MEAVHALLQFLALEGLQVNINQLAGGGLFYDHNKDPLFMHPDFAARSFACSVPEPKADRPAFRAPPAVLQSRTPVRPAWRRRWGDGLRRYRALRPGRATNRTIPWLGDPNILHRARESICGCPSAGSNWIARCFRR